MISSVLNVKALVGAFSRITNLRVDLRLFQALVCPRRGIVASVNSGETDVDVRHVLPCSGHPALDYNSVIFYIYFNSFESFVQSLTR